MESSLQVKMSPPDTTVSIKREPKDDLDLNALHLPVRKQEERSSSLLQEQPEPPHIKEEQEELLQRPEEVAVKGEDMMDPTDYAILYHRQALRFHLDKIKTPGAPEAYSVLSDPKKKDGEEGKSTWIVGSSLIARAHLRACQTIGPDLGLPAKIRWLGKEGLRWGDVVPTLKTELRRQPPPDLLVLHAGGNDLGAVPKLTLFNKMKRDVASIKQLCPQTLVVFSGIVARRHWQDVKDARALNRTRIWLNTKIGGILRKKSGGSDFAQGNLRLSGKH